MVWWASSRRRSTRSSRSAPKTRRSVTFCRSSNAASSSATRQGGGAPAMRLPATPFRSRRGASSRRHCDLLTHQVKPMRYAVSPADKEPLLRVFGEGLRAGGAEILNQPFPGSAPFEYVILSPNGERLRLIAYIFRATKYHSGERRERPEDEHRFQIKYGSDFTDYHDLELPAPGDKSTVTLFVGVHLEEGVIVGCDPTLHNPAWFSKSVEFKQEQIDLARKYGWFGWERERREGRRKEALPLLDYSTETVIAFTPANLVRYIDLERVATGLDPGERLLLAETPVGEKRHALEVELGLSA